MGYVASWRRLAIAVLAAGLVAAWLPGPAGAQIAYVLLKATAQGFGAATEINTSVAIQSTTRIDASVTDADGNTYVAGTFRPGVPAGGLLTVGQQLNGDPLKLVSPTDAGIAFVVKYDVARRVVWAMNFSSGAFNGSTPNFTLADIALGSGANPDVYVTGQMSVAAMIVLPAPTPSVPNLSRKGVVDSFLVKLDGATGAPVLAANYGGPSASLKANAIVHDGHGNTIYIAGGISGAAINTSSPALTVPFSGTSGEDGFLLHVAADGSFTSAANFGGGGGISATVQAVEVDAAGNVYAAGTTDGNLVLDPAPQAPAQQPALLGMTDGFAVKYDPSFARQWFVNYGSGTTSRFAATALAVDDGNIYVAGTIQSAITLPGLSGSTGLLGQQAALVFKASAATGEASWATPFDGANVTARPASLAVDGQGKVWVGTNFAGGSLTAPYGQDPESGLGQSVAMARLRADGVIDAVVAIAPGTAVVQLGRGRGVAANELFTVAGSFDGTMTLPSMARSPDSVLDAAVLRTVPLLTMSMTLAGQGSGRITSSRGSLNCPTTCVSQPVAQGQVVVLTATAATGSTFTGWSGDCTGSASPLSVTLATAINCTATFAPAANTGPTPSEPPAPPPSFVTSPPPVAENLQTVGSGSGSMSFASSFTDRAGLTFSATPAGGGSLPDWISFDPATVSFSYSVPMPPDLPIQPLAETRADGRAGRADARASWANTVYPLLLRVAQFPVVLTATDKVTGQSFASTIQMSFHAPRSPVAISGLSLSLDRAWGDRSSGRSALSHDGGQMVFETAATNLFPAAASSHGDIVRYHGLSGARDRLTQTAIPGGGVANTADGPSFSPAVSADGAYAAFASDAPGISMTPSGARRQVYRASLSYPRIALDQARTPAPEMVSATAAGIAGNGRSDNPSLSQDGRYAAFDSDATNFADQLDGSRRVWRKDLSTGALIQVAAGSNPSISWDGRFVAYEVAGQIQVKDLMTDGIRAIGPGTAARLSARADRIVFVQSSQVVQVDLITGTRHAIGAGDQPAMSADGRFVAFRAAGSAGNGFTQVWLRDVDRGVTALVTQTAAGAGGNGDSLYPSVSGDGAQIGFVSSASDLVNGKPGGTQAYVAANPLPLPAKTGYWYQAAANSGQGWLLERWGNQAYVAGLVYDAAGRPTWISGLCGVSGLTCSGMLSSFSGGAPFGAATGAGPAIGQSVGVMLTTSDDGRSTILKVGGGAAQTLTTFPIGGAATTGFAGLPQAGWWVETGSTGGNGYFIGVDTQAQTDGSVKQIAYVSVLTFEASGQPVWYTSQAALGADLDFVGTLMQYGTGTGGSAIGQLRIAFTGSDQARINLPNGRTASIARLRF